MNALDCDGADFEKCFRLAPCVSGYVGGDITSALAALGLDRTEKLTLFIDIGTNGEIALGNKNGFLTAATAAGPCFSGAGEKGSVLISLVASALERGQIGPSGRLVQEKRMQTFSSKRNGSIHENKMIETTLQDNNRCIPVMHSSVKQGSITQNAIRNFQLAKGAVRAGIETLIEVSNINPSEIQQLIVAGDFGGRIDLRAAVRTGLLPNLMSQCSWKQETSDLCPQGKELFLQPGNTALKGAVLGLSEEGRNRIQNTCALCHYYDLSGSNAFQKHFLRYINFT